MAVCGIQCVDLVSDTIKILGTHFSYNEKLKEERNFCLIIANIRRVLKLWKLQNLTLEGKILIFKTLALSKIIFQAFATPIPIYVVTELEKVQKSFLWQNSTSKIKLYTLCIQRWWVKKRWFSEKNHKSSVLMDKKIIWWLVPWMEDYNSSLNQ